MVTWCLALRQNIIAVGSCGEKELFTSWQTGSRQRKCRKGARERYSLQGHRPTSLLPQARPHLLKIPQPLKIIPQLGTKH
jgi:hypothetical protein